MSLLSELSDLFGDAFEKIGVDRRLGDVVVSQRPELGQFQCNGALPAAKQLGENPRGIAERIVSEVSGDRRLNELGIAGPGFINLDVSDAFLLESLRTMAQAEDLGIPKAPVPKRIIVDYGGPNISKAMHIGHLRATIIGDSLKRVLVARGHDVLGDIHIGDWGKPIGMLIVQLRDRRPDLPYFDADFAGPYPEESPVTIGDLQEIYPQANKRADSEPDFADQARTATQELQAGRPGYVALWEQFSRVSRASHEQDFQALGVEFELWYGESTVRDGLASLVARLETKGAAHQSEGALIIDVASPDDRMEMPPLILTTSSGAFVYQTTDLATIQMRVTELAADAALYVVDARQSLHFEQLFRAARLAGIAPESFDLEHIPFGTVNGKDGKPFKTREGEVVLLGDVIDLVTEAAGARLEEADIAQDYPVEERARIARQVGLAALKFGDLQNHRASNYVFDLDRFTSFEGKTGPYLQYTAVRMRSIRRKAAAKDFEDGPLLEPIHHSERALGLLLLRLPDVVERTVEFRAPNHLAEYAYEIASRFNRFYDACHILREEDPQRRGSWLSLVGLTLSTLKRALDLLGIEVPERM